MGFSGGFAAPCEFFRILGNVFQILAGGKLNRQEFQELRRGSNTSLSTSDSRRGSGRRSGTGGLWNARSKAPASSQQGVDEDFRAGSPGSAITEVHLGASRV